MTTTTTDDDDDSDGNDEYIYTQLLKAHTPQTLCALFYATTQFVLPFQDTGTVLDCTLSCHSCALCVLPFSFSLSFCLFFSFFLLCVLHVKCCVCWIHQCAFFFFSGTFLTTMFDEGKLNTSTHIHWYILKQSHNRTQSTCTRSVDKKASEWNEKHAHDKYVCCWCWCVLVVWAPRFVH